MLLAAIAFLHQGSLTVASQAAAAAGFMPQPAETVIGSVHVHGKVAGHVHTHGGENAAGHTHDHDHDDMDEPASTLFWALGSVTAVAPRTELVTVALNVVSAEQGLPSERLDGVEPDGLSRPPSTPNIA
jgi:hypothetical protein